MRTGTFIAVAAVLASLLALGGVLTEAGPPAAGNSPAFVTRSGDQLQLNGKTFRFSGANIYWGGLDNNGRIGYTYPTQFRVQAALQTAAGMGATVVRCQTCGISVGGPLTVEPKLGQFNQEALGAIDYFVAQAQRYGIRLVIPLVDAYSYYLGSYCDFTDWLGLSAPGGCPSPASASAFYDSPRAVEAFEDYIGVLLNHVNAYTGVKNSDNPTIMAWETGNELPLGTGGAAELTRWTAQIAGYLKQQAPHQLVMDGARELDPGNLKLASVDVQDQHYYPVNVSALDAAAKQVAAAGQAMVVGEYAWNNPASPGGLGTFMADIFATASIAGDLYWDLLPQNDDFGYIEHYDGYGLHFPGDRDDVKASGSNGVPVTASWSDAGLVSNLRRHAFIISGRQVPPYPVPAAPVVTSVEHAGSDTEGIGNLLEWRGSPMASSYLVRRSVRGPSGPWTTVGQPGADVTEVPYLDRNGPGGPNVWYQVTAVNPDGKAGPPSASFQVTDKTLSDNLNGLGLTMARTGGVTLSQADPPRYGGDQSRADFPADPANQSVTWHEPGVTGIEALAYYDSQVTQHFLFYVSWDGVSWMSVPAVDVQANQLTNGSPDDRLCYVYTIDDVQRIVPGASYVRVQRYGGAVGDAQLGEIRFTHP